MEINVSQQLKAPIGTTRDYKVSETIDVNGSNRMFQGDVSLIHTNRGLLAKGTLHAEVEATCSRCLGHFECPLTLNIEEEYLPTTDIISGAKLALPDEPGYFTIDENHILDLTETIQQYALMAIPMKLLCREDCAGLCPNCGHNLNEGACGCPSQNTDPRWAELSKLNASDATSVKERKEAK